MNVASWNIAQLPVWYNQLPNAATRLSALCSEIIAHAYEIDIVCFQELFASSARDTVRSRLSGLYPHMYLDTSIGKFLVGVNSGLGIISKYPLEEHVLHTYTEYEDIEIFAKKGVMGVRTSVPPVLLSRLSAIYIFTTHLQAGGSTPVLSWFNKLPADTIKVHQLREAAELIHGMVNDPHALVMLCGDFNLDAATEVAPGLEQIRQVFPAARDVYDAASTPVTYSVQDRHKRIDYFIVLSCPINVDVRSVLGKFGAFTMSDHLPASLAAQPYISLI